MDLRFSERTNAAILKAIHGKFVKPVIGEISGGISWGISDK